jgi:phage-related protein
MLEYLTLNFDGKSSSDFGIICANGSGNSLYEDLFVANKSIEEDSSPDRNIPYFKDVTLSPLDFPPLTLYWTDGFNEEGLQLIKQWLNKKTYSEFFFEEYPIRHYFGLLYADNSLSHNGLGQGFATIKIRCNSPYAYSPAITNQNTITIPSEGKDLMIENKGDEFIYPSIQFTKIGDGDFSILNLTDGGNTFTLTELKDNETITIDNYNEEIDTDLPNIYRYENHNGNFLKLPVGRNRLIIRGECKLKYHYRYVYM